MKKQTIYILFVLASALFAGTGSSAAVRKDSLRVDTVLNTLNHLVKTVETDILPNVSGETKTNLASATTKVKQSLKSAGKSFQSRMKAPVMTLTAKERKLFLDLESQVNKMKSSVPVKSEYYRTLAVSHLAIYKATQEMDSTNKKPLISTYEEAYDPNTSSNRQVTLLGVYLNFDTEYRITVGGMEMGPDIVDPERLVFTFPEKLLPGITQPTYVEIKAAPKMKVGSGKSGKVQPYKEQIVYLLVLPVKG